MLRNLAQMPGFTRIRLASSAKARRVHDDRGFYAPMAAYRGSVKFSRVRRFVGDVPRDFLPPISVLPSFCRPQREVRK